MRPLWERAGGEAGIRAVLADFYEHVFDDLMIGFHFRASDKARLIDKECELTLAALGADVAYSGRPVAALHLPLRIMGGHFRRRRKLLADAIDRAGLPPDVRDAWLAHTDALRGEVTRGGTGECDGRNPSGD
jgi:hemoglobin